MKKFIIAMLAIAAIIMIMSIPVEGAEQWFTKKYTFTGACDVVDFKIVGLGTRYVGTNSGGYLTSTTSAKAAEFIIIPTEYSGYYVFRSVTDPNLALTYTNKGFKMSAINPGDYTHQVFKDTQMFRLVWRNCYPQGYDNRPCNGWQLVCKANKKAVTDSGYSVFGVRLKNG